MQISKLERVFKHNGKTLSDPNPNLTPDEVLNLYTGQYPELNNSTVTPGKIENDKQVYEFSTTIGKKG